MDGIFLENTIYHNRDESIKSISISCMERGREKHLMAERSNL
jgi:hypothetical protein